MSSYKFSGSIDIERPGGGRGWAVVVVAVVALGVSAWICRHVLLVLGVLGGLVVAAGGLLWLAGRLQSRRGAIVFHQLPELPAGPPQRAVAPVVHVHLEGPEAVELARQLVEGRQALPAPPEV